MKIDLILWDWDNTLLDTKPIATAALKKLGHETGITITDDIVLEIIGGHLVDFWYRTYGPDPLPYIRRYIKYYQELSSNIKPFTEAIPILQWIKEKKIPQMVVSNKNQEIIDDEAKRLGLSSYFNQIVGTRNQGYGKPEKEFADIIFGKNWPKNILIIGDGESDMQFAKLLGAYALFVREGNEPVNFPYDKRVQNLNEVFEFLKKSIKSGSDV